MQELSALNARALHVFNVGEENWRDCRQRSRWSFLVCNEVENFGLQMTPEGDVFGIRGSSGMALGGGDLNVDLDTIWSDSGTCGCYWEDPM